MNHTPDEALRWQLRGLRRDIEPSSDLWPDMAARIAVTPQVSVAPIHSPVRRAAPWALAASVLLALGAAWHMLPGAQIRSDSTQPYASQPDAQVDATLANSDQSNPVIRQQAVSMTLDYENALAHLQQARTHPEMHVAFDELDRSASQILTAIDNNPDTPFLLGQLRRTYARRLQLTQRAIIT